MSATLQGFQNVGRERLAFVSVRAADPRVVGTHPDYPSRVVPVPRVNSECCWPFSPPPETGEKEQGIQLSKSELLSRDSLGVTSMVPGDGPAAITKESVRNRGYTVGRPISKGRGMGGMG